MLNSYGAILDGTDSSTSHNTNGVHNRPGSSASSSTVGGHAESLTPEGIDRLLQNATLGMQMLDAALRQVQGSSVPGGRINSGSVGDPTGPATSTNSSSLAMANTMPAAAPPSTAGSTASSNSRSHYQHVSGQGGPHSNSASPKLSAKEEVRMVEDGPSSRGPKPESKESGGDRAKRQVSTIFDSLVSLRPSFFRSYFCLSISISVADLHSTENW